MVNTILYANKLLCIHVYLIIVADKEDKYSQLAEDNKLAMQIVDEEGIYMYMLYLPILLM